MIIEVTYNVTDVYMSTTVSPIYITVDYSGSGGSGASVWGSITGTLSNQTDLQTALDGKFDDPTGTTLQYIDGTGALQTFPTALDAINLITEVYNQSGATITKGTVVYINGGHGNLPTIAKAIATSDATSAQTFGIVREDITNMNNGYVIQVGLIENLNTSAYSDGTQLYLSGTTAGGYTSTKPYAPIHLVYIGIVVRAHPTQGTIQIKIQNGYELDELHNVSAQTPSNKDGIFYNSGNGLWENKSIGTVLGYTPEQPLTFSSPLSRSTNTVSINAASSSSNGYLSSTDWSTFNNKQNALTNPVTGTGTTNELAYFSGTSAISSLTTATYPSLTELSYIKGVTSAVQTQLNAKQGTINLTTTGTSGAATLVGNTLNIPQYSGGGGMAIGGSITSATLGSVLFAGTSGVLSQSNANFFYDSNNVRLGIGTNTPAFVLDIAGNVDGLFRQHIKNSSTGTLAQTAILLRNDANTQYMFGIVSTGFTTAAGLIANDAFVQHNDINNSYPNSGLVLKTSNLNPIKFQTNSVERARFFATGNFAIGTTTDAGYRLDVSGTMRVTDELSVNGINIGRGSGAIATNTRVGTTSLNSNITGYDNVAIGVTALRDNTTGFRNIAIGNQAGLRITTGTQNIAIGVTVLTSNLTGANNIAIGYNALVYNTNSNHIGIGDESLFNNTSASSNIGIGVQSLYGITTGGSNIALGYRAGRYAGSGTTANQTSNNSIYLGYQSRAGASGNTNEIVIGYDVVGNGSNTSTIGNSSTVATYLGGKTILSASTTSRASLNIISGTAPTTPNDGDLWFDGIDLKMRIGGVTKTFTLV